MQISDLKLDTTVRMFLWTFDENFAMRPVQSPCFWTPGLSTYIFCDFSYFVSKSHLKCPLNVQFGHEE